MSVRKLNHIVNHTSSKYHLNISDVLYLVSINQNNQRPIAPIPKSKSSTRCISSLNSERATRHVPSTVQPNLVNNSRRPQYSFLFIFVFEVKL